MLTHAIRRFTIAAAALVAAATLTALAPFASTATASIRPAHTGPGRHIAATGILGGLTPGRSHLVAASGAYNFLINHDGLCLGIRDGRDDAPAIQWPCETSANQLWKFGTCINGACQLVNEDNQCLGVSGESTMEGAQVVGWTCNGHPDQYWEEATVGDYSAFVNEHSTMADGKSMVLGVLGGTTNQGQPIVQWPYVAGAPNQLWY